jgi:hypothetical protein
MKFKIEDIDFKGITPREFENLCYDLLIKYNYHNLIWREGGADNGRDIEAKHSFNTMIKDKETNWFFECKLYNAGGVPPNELTSKVAWADAELPDYLVFFVSSYLTNNARTWLEKIIEQKQYDITVIEGEELKNRILKYPELIERYFSLNRYEKLFKDVRDYKTKFRINPSFEFLNEIASNIDLERLTVDELGFILTNFYNQYKSFEGRNDYHGDFHGTEVNRVLDYLKRTITNEELKSFQTYFDDYDELGGSGIFDEMDLLECEEYIHEMKLYNFQSYDLHLNHKKEQNKWKIGEYLFVIYEDVAFEIFVTEVTEIRIIKDFKPERINELSLNLSGDIVEKYNEYLEELEYLEDLEDLEDFSA